MSDNSFTELHHPHDLTYQLRRRSMIDSMLPLQPDQLVRQIRYQQQQPAPIDPSKGDLTKSIIRDLVRSNYMPSTVKSLLDTTGATSGNAIIRQDLEAPIYSLFVKKFPLWDRLDKGQANGLVHAAVQMTSPDNINGLGGTVISELQAVTAVNSNYQRITFPIAILATMRGVSIKEQAAVMAGGASFNPLQMELAKQHWPCLVTI